MHGSKHSTLSFLAMPNQPERERGGEGDGCGIQRSNTATSRETVKTVIHMGIGGGMRPQSDHLRCSGAAP